LEDPKTLEPALRQERPDLLGIEQGLVKLLEIPAHRLFRIPVGVPVNVIEIETWAKGPGSFFDVGPGDNGEVGKTQIARTPLGAKRPSCAPQVWDAAVAEAVLEERVAEQEIDIPHEEVQLAQVHHDVRGFRVPNVDVDKAGELGVAAPKVQSQISRLCVSAASETIEKVPGKTHRTRVDSSQQSSSPLDGAQGHLTSGGNGARGSMSWELCAKT
jgi:hypothetical protein